MNKEKVIKTQARQSLKGNLTVLASGLALVCLVLILADAARYLFLVLFDVIDLENDTITDGGFAANAVITSLTLIALSFALPLINGILYAAGKAARGEKAAALDLFHFYSSAPLFFKSWLIDAALCMIYTLLYFVFDIYRYFEFLGLIGGGITDLKFPVWFIALAAFLGSVLIRLFFFLLLIYYPLTLYSLDSSGSAAKYIFGLMPFSAKHLGEATRLAFSFIPWILLCFFVLPAIYVIPYISTAVMNSSRWLLELEKNRGFRL